MPRKAHIVKREIVPDPMYQSTLISKFVNCMMYGGKKSTAQGILYNAMDVIQKKTSDDPLKLFKKADRKRQAGPGSEVPPRGRFDLPGAGRSRSGSANIAGDSLDSDLLASPWRKIHGREARR